jgi:L-threonylcarbamoyladenylate synthase
VSAPPEPRLLRIRPEDPASWAETVDDVAAALGGGEVVVLPAEGLYGYHARADRPDALKRLDNLKPREAGRGWIVLLDDPRALERFEPPPPPAALRLAAFHWPGALTLVVSAPDWIPPVLRATDGTVAVRCPGNAFLRDVVRAAGGALISTSANRPGEAPPATLAAAALHGVPLAVDAGGLSGMPSTLAGVDGSTVRVLRQGAVALAEPGGNET